jgi:4-aminobutyrate aminotransferase/(S)-3-amino-2-methylpropionate transaminase
VRTAHSKPFEVFAYFEIREWNNLVKSYKLKGPKIVVEPPGPKSRKALARKEKYITNGIKIGLPASLEFAEGPFMQDVDGNVYLDFTSGIGVHNCGHRPAAMVKACQDQLDKFIHICFMVSPYESYIKLAEELSKICPGKLTKSIFLNSGSEAIENAVKIARAYTKKKWIMSYRTAFHGRTFLDISLTGKEKPYREGFGPLVPYIQHVEYAYCYRCPLCLEFPSCGIACADTIRTVMETKPLENDVCCLVAEPVQGEGGFINPPPGYWEKIRKICDDNSALLIDDEVQTGFGRTGKMFAIEHWKCNPDMLVTGKGLSLGMPLGGVTGRDDVMSAPGPASLGGTFGGNPVCCAGAIESIKLTKKALPNTRMINKVETKRLNEWKDQYEVVGDVRGLGAMMGMELVKTKKGKEPVPELTRNIQLNCFKHGLYILGAGQYSNVIRLHPPLIIKQDLLEKGLDILESALKEETKKAGL